MYSVETSIVFSIVILALGYFMNFSFKLEKKIRSYINQKYKITYEEYNVKGKKKFVPEKIQKIITSIEGDKIDD